MVINTMSGDWEMDDRDTVASERLFQRRPGAITLGIRVGYKAAYHFGHRETPEEECYRQSQQPASPA